MNRLDPPLHGGARFTPPLLVACSQGWSACSDRDMGGLPAFVTTADRGPPWLAEPRPLRACSPAATRSATPEIIPESLLVREAKVRVPNTFLVR
jgi:hypothetical protein